MSLLEDNNLETDDQKVNPWKSFINPSPGVKIATILILGAVFLVLLIVVIIVAVFFGNEGDLVNSAALEREYFQRSDIYGNHGVTDLYAVNVGERNITNPCPTGKVISPNINGGHFGNKIYLCMDVGVASEGVQDISTVAGFNPYITCPPGYTKGGQNLNAGGHDGNFIYLCVKYGPPPYLQNIHVEEEKDKDQAVNIDCPHDNYFPRGDDLNQGTGGHHYQMCVTYPITEPPDFNTFGVGRLI